MADDKGGSGVLPVALLAGAAVIGGVVAYQKLKGAGPAFVETVVDPAGKAIQDAVVKVAGQSVVTDASGQAKFSKIDPGTYTLTATAAGYKANSKTVTIPATGADTIVLTPQAGAGGLSLVFTPNSILPPGSVGYVIEGGTPSGSWVMTAVKPGGTSLQLASGIFGLTGSASGQLQFVTTQGGYGGAISATPAGDWMVSLQDQTTKMAAGPVALTIQSSGGGGALQVSVDQNASGQLVWYISGLTPKGQFTVIESTSLGFGDFFGPYSADASGSSSMPFNSGGAGPGVKVTLIVTDASTQHTGQVTYTVPGATKGLALQASDNMGVLTVLASGGSPSGPFVIDRVNPDGSTYPMWVWGLFDATGHYTNSIPVYFMPKGTYGLTLRDQTSGATATATFSV